MSNPYLAMFKKETTKIEKAVAKAVDKATEQSQHLVEAACSSMGVELSEQASVIYSQMVAATTTEDISAASGAALAEAVQSMIEAYYNGNTDSFKPVIEACEVWLTVKHDGHMTATNLPNNLRLLVSRRSEKWANPEEGQQMADFKLVLSVDGKKGAKKVVIKEEKLTGKPKKTKAQRAFDTITKMDQIDRDELMRLISSNAELLGQFATLSTVNEIKTEQATRETVHNVEVRRNAAVEREDELQDALDQASEAKLALCDQIADVEDELQGLELKATQIAQERADFSKKAKNARKPEKVEEWTAKVDEANAQFDEVHAMIAEREATLSGLRAKQASAIKVLEAAEVAYNNQAHLVAAIGKELVSTRTEATVH